MGCVAVDVDMCVYDVRVAVVGCCVIAGVVCACLVLMLLWLLLLLLLML